MTVNIVTMMRLLSGMIVIKNSKDELMPITWHSSRWWDWCISEDEKNETEKFLEVTDSCF